MPGFTTTGNPSLYPTVSTSFTNSSSFISSEILLYPNTQPKIAKQVCNGFKQVQTFIFSTLSTVSRSVNINPPLVKSKRPLGKSSSITKYSVSSAFTKGATYVFLEVITGSNSSTPSSNKIFSTEASGRGVILSIILQVNDTLFESIYSTNSFSALSFSAQAFANAEIAAYNLSPL